MGATLDTWVKAVFDHPFSEPEWYWRDDFDTFWEQIEINDTLTVEYMTRLFSAPQLLSGYSHVQVAQGLWFLIGESSPGKSAYAILNRDVALRERIDCVRAMANFFSQFVATIAPGAANTQSDPLQIACWMWWDILPTYGGDAVEPELHDACLDTMSAILSLSPELCHLSALHGLNHWYANDPERVQAIVDSFLNRAANLTPRVVQYAARARAGVGQ